MQWLKKINWAALCVLACFFLIPSAGLGQQNISFSTLQIDLLPEYDHPSMMVIYQARLSDTVQLPATLTMRIPAAAGEPSGVAERQNAASPPLNVAYTREEQGEWAALRFTVTQPEIQIEYYDPTLIRDGSHRSFVFHWPGDYNVEQVVVLVQQPMGAENMQIFPRLPNISQDQNGLVYYGAEIGSFRAGETFELRVDYQKDSSSLTAEFLPIQPSQPIDENTTGRMSLVSILPWGLGALGVLVILAGLYWYWATERRTEAPLPVPREKGSPDAAAGETGQAGVYCHQCGKRALAGDKFCRTCGTKLRA